MDSHKKTLRELQDKITEVLNDVDKRNLRPHQAATRIVEIREQIDELLAAMQKQSKPTNTVK